MDGGLVCGFWGRFWSRSWLGTDTNLRRTFRPESNLCSPERSAQAALNSHYPGGSNLPHWPKHRHFSNYQPFHQPKSLLLSFLSRLCFTKCYLQLRGKYWSEKEVKWLRGRKVIKALSRKFWGNFIDLPGFPESQTWWRKKNKTRRADWKKCGVVCLLLTSRVTAAKNTERYFIK